MRSASAMSGRATPSLLARHYGTIDACREAMLVAAKHGTGEGNTSEAYQDLNDIGGVGEIVADAVVEFFAEPRNVKALGELLREIEVRPAEQPRKSSPVSARPVVFTGSLTKIHPRRSQGGGGASRRQGCGAPVLDEDRLCRRR